MLPMFRGWHGNALSYMVLLLCTLTGLFTECHGALGYQHAQLHGARLHKLQSADTAFFKASTPGNVSSALSTNKPGLFYSDQDSTNTSTTCFHLAVLALIVVCCVSPCVMFTCGNLAAWFLILAMNIAIIYFVVFNGYIVKLWSGEQLGIWCVIISMVAVFLLVVSIVIPLAHCCGIAIFGGAALFMLARRRNAQVKHMRSAMEAIGTRIDPQMQDLFKSEEFQKICDGLFDAADQDNNANLDVGELRQAVVCHFGMTIKDVDLFREAFDKNADSKIDKAEFREMMKYFYILADRAKEPHHA